MREETAIKKDYSTLEVITKILFVPGYIPYSLCKIAASERFTEKPFWIKVGVTIGIPITSYYTLISLREIYQHREELGTLVAKLFQ